jgi:hypothetical protein
MTSVTTERKGGLYKALSERKLVVGSLGSRILLYKEHGIGRSRSYSERKKNLILKPCSDFHRCHLLTRDLLDSAK